MAGAPTAGAGYIDRIVQNRHSIREGEGLMKLHIAMACYNNRYYTRGFIDSVSRRSNGHQILWHLVDNGSTDGTYEYLAGLNPRFLKRLDRNDSLARAWNEALAAARTGDPDLICFANNDVKVSAGWLDPIERERSIHAGKKRYWLSHEVRGAEQDFEGTANRNRLEFAGQTVRVEHLLCITFFPPEAVDLFHPIPEELTLWYGDNWIDARLAKHGYELHIVKDSSVLHFLSKTVEITPGVSERIERDKKAWERIRNLV